MSSGKPVKTRECNEQHWQLRQLLKQISNLCDTNLEVVAKWLSCNGEIWGVGPTAVFASAAALFLYNELESTVFVAGDQTHVSWLEKTLISTMVLGMLALMIHLWVCSMRFFQYYLDTLIRDSPSVLLEMTTASLLGGQAEIMPLGPLTRFLRQQQPQIHMTVCWFLSLCYADYVRKNYCQRQTELHSRAVRGLHSTVEKVNSFVGSVHQRLRGFVPPGHMEACPMTDCTTYTVGARLVKSHRSTSATHAVGSLGEIGNRVTLPRRFQSRRRTSVYGWYPSRTRPLLMLSRNSRTMLHRRGARAIHRTPASLVLSPIKKPSLEDCPWRSIEKIPFESLVR
ncbi:uncharacterized protein LOC118269222 isoform X1 [Spodoptera frugiperda]|uniref:Uncharacterized protein LOC118269222 isoform X1 n=1 Tax=Spodoptera frugiperda TaxID=7108 RepID=A0A9R0D4M9_SPOFR|nr:uncharacterized protein LOC118269222 isoform X1 [Spodoptera frugiperda]